MTTPIDRASLDAYRREEETPLEETSLEAIQNSESAIDFRTFLEDYPERLLSLLDQLRPEFVELFMETYALGKDQYFLGDTHGFVQTRTWQALRIIEKAIGALLVLGPEPSASDMQGVLVAANLDQTAFGSLAELIACYAATHDYVAVAEYVGAPAPAIRKIFRPAIKVLSASHNLRVAAIGAYLHSLTHQTSLKQPGLSKRALKRLKRVGTHRFVAPALDESPLLNFGNVEKLEDTSWCMFEASWEGEHNWLPLRTAVLRQAKKIFGKKPAQVFMPADVEGKLLYGYVFARGLGSVRGLLRVQGISSISTQYHETDDSSNVEVPDARAVQIPNADLQKMIAQYKRPKVERIRKNDFVRILTGEASRYCGTVVSVKKNTAIVRVSFPTLRRFIVRADISSLKKLEAKLEEQNFWGVRS